MVKPTQDRLIGGGVNKHNNTNRSMLRASPSTKPNQKLYNFSVNNGFLAISFPPTSVVPPAHTTGDAFQVSLLFALLI